MGRAEPVAAMTANPASLPPAFPSARRGPATAAPWRLDRRTRFRDVSRDRSLAHPRSPRVLQFYSAVPNIGNFTAALGVQTLLGTPLEVWNAHQRPIDWAWIHDRYRAVIVGGAGLLHPAFAPFWDELDRECRLPVVLWGLGGCWPDHGRSPAASSAAARVGARAALVQVRDPRSAEEHGWRDAEIAACPTLAFVREGYLHLRRTSRRPRLLFANHPELVTEDETRRIRAVLASKGRFASTDHGETRWWGLHEILSRRYVTASRVVTTRLHGAIIAASLGVPWIALARDAKLRAFATRTAGGVCVDDVAALDDALAARVRPAPALAPTAQRAFAKRVRDVLDAAGVPPF